jgi:hypothetical protein
MSQLTKQQLQVENNVSFPNNNTNYITPTLLRGFNSDLIDSVVVGLSTGSFATTGSNTYTGDQLIYGSYTINMHDNGYDSGMVANLMYVETGSAYWYAEVGISGVGDNDLEVGVSINGLGGVTDPLIYSNTGLGEVPQISFNDSAVSILNNVIVSGDISGSIVGIGNVTDYSASVDSRLNNAQGVQGADGSQGADGTNGTQGATGTGLQGATGTQGATAAQGQVGLQGVQGFKGNTGNTGAQGILGTQGIQGTIGGQGVVGSQGSTGAGVQGADGAQGTDGIQGADGTQGSTGAGLQGSTGAQGETGIQGGVGTQGAIGAKGDQGVQGIQGIQGLRGNVGSQGTQGIIGNGGAQGQVGLQGAQGFIGSQGRTGTQGNTGIGTQGSTGTQGTAGTTPSTASFATTGSNEFFGQQAIRSTTGIPLILDHSDASPTQNTLISFLNSGSAHWLVGNVGTNDSFDLYNTQTSETPLSIAQTNDITLQGVINAEAGIVAKANTTISNESFLQLTPSSSAGGNSALRIFTKPSGSSPDYYLNIQPVPGIAGNAVAIANFSNGGDIHFMTFDLDNTVTNIETALYTSGPITTTNANPGITLQTNLAGSGSAYNITVGKVDNTTDPANVFSAISLADDHTGVQVGMAYNSYTPYYTSSVPMFYGGENYNNSDAAIILPGNTIEIVKPTSFKAAMNIAPLDPLPNGTIGDLAVSGSSLYFYNGAWKEVLLSI